MAQTAVLEFGYELVISMTDPTTGEVEPVFKRMGRLKETALTSTSTGEQREMKLTHRITGDEDFLDRTLAEIDVVPLDIIRARGENESVYLEVTGDKVEFLNFA